MCPASNSSSPPQMSCAKSARSASPGTGPVTSRWRYGTRAVRQLDAHPGREAPADRADHVAAVEAGVVPAPLFRLAGRRTVLIGRAPAEASEHAERHAAPLVGCGPDGRRADVPELVRPVLPSGPAGGVERDLLARDHRAVLVHERRPDEPVARAVVARRVAAERRRELARLQRDDVERRPAHECLLDARIELVRRFRFAHVHAQLGRRVDPGSDEEVGEQAHARHDERRVGLLDEPRGLVAGGVQLEVGAAGQAELEEAVRRGPSAQADRLERGQRGAVVLGARARGRAGERDQCAERRDPAAAHARIRAHAHIRAHACAPLSAGVRRPVGDSIASMR